jgi:polysaccharide pyruvyl transferase WcaK-like protein
MKKIWVVHRFKTNNLGDKMLGNGLASLLRKRHFDTKQLEFTGDISISNILAFTFFSVLLNIIKLRKERPWVIFIGGGQLLLPGFHFALLGWTFLSKIAKVKLVLFSIGTEKIYGSFSKLQKLTLRYVLKQADVVRLRDNHSQKIIQELTGKVYPLVPDTAYGLELDMWKRQNKQDIYVCPTWKDAALPYGFYSDMEEYYEDFCKKIKSVIKNDEKIFIFSTHKNDLISVKDLYGYLTGRCFLKNVSVLSIETEDSLLEIMSKARVVIGGRMHSIIISHILGAEGYTINQNRKIRCFSESILPHPPELISEELERSLDHVLFKELE